MRRFVLRSRRTGSTRWGILANPGVAIVPGPSSVSNCTRACLSCACSALLLRARRSTSAGPFCVSTFLSIAWIDPVSSLPFECPSRFNILPRLRRPRLTVVPLGNTKLEAFETFAVANRASSLSPYSPSPSCSPPFPDLTRSRIFMTVSTRSFRMRPVEEDGRARGS